jgi:hypothetical protein
MSRDYHRYCLLHAINTKVNKTDHIIIYIIHIHIIYIHLSYIIYTCHTIHIHIIYTLIIEYTNKKSNTIHNTQYKIQNTKYNS